MSFGLGEIVLLGLLAFVAFGPRKPSTGPNRGRRIVVDLVAALLPALLFVDRAGLALDLAARPRVLLAAAAAAAAFASLFLSRAANAWLDRREQRDRAGAQKRASTSPVSRR